MNMYTLWHHSCDTDDWICIHYDNTHVTQMPEHVYIMTPLMWHRWLNMYTLWQHSWNTDAWTCIHYDNTCVTDAWTCTCIHYDTTHVTQMPEHVYIMTPLMWHRWLNMYTLWQHSCNTDSWTCIHYDTTHVTQMPEHVYIMKTLM